MSSALKELEILKSRNVERPECQNTGLYRILYKTDIFVLAYERIKSKNGNMTRGANNETLDGISPNWIDKTISELRTQKFKFSASRMVKIPKKNGNTRTLGIAPPREKVVQEVIRLILEAIYDAPEGTIFQECSHGFRANRSCHTALKEVKSKWNGTKWFIEGDISDFFDEIDHHVLIKLLGKKIKDEKFIQLMWKYIKAGYTEGNEVHKVANISGTPQGGILSPLLSNIYLNELDKYALELSKKHTKGTERRINPAYTRISSRIRRNKNPQRMKELYKERRNTQSRMPDDPNYVRVRYIRYADDWIIGVTGSRLLAEEIRRDMERFLKDELKLKLNLDKTFIRHAKTERATFLGVEINTSMNKANHSTISGNKKVKLQSDNIQLNVNMDGIIKRLNKAGMCKGNGFPICRNYHINYEDWEIIRTHNSVLDGLSNYYSFVSNRNKLRRVEYIIRYSAAKTLASKYKTSMAKIFKSYGNNLTIEYGKDKKVGIRDDIDWTIKVNNFKVSMWERSAVLDGLLYKRKVTKSRLGSPCAICGSNEGVQMHHVRHIRKSGVKYGGFDKYLGAINRKQVPLCKQHHLDIHNGKYDGAGLAQIFEEIKSHKKN
ncbi:hypothetical protein PN36_14080 [Candidatus Thiomargarita nelsonii]|uniref:Reverse transcriptase domain-containing protein n=1 Tax=Candidatus Thiomargarita nelsonii TaxID=1003181 RepID=A0A0A6PCN8_9GAMM|nr:hypothetical protein PN36_14080 [Candidatus Thiomargarita nelsonii]